METWTLSLGANGVIAIAYFIIAWTIMSGIGRSGQIFANPLGVATGFIFLSCSIGHAAHAIHLVLPIWGLEVAEGLAARQHFADWHIWAIDGFTAGMAIWYLSLRSRFPALVRGSKLFEDVRQRQAQALEIHDNVVQGLAEAKLSIERGEQEAGLEKLGETLERSRKIITDLMGTEGSEIELGPGDLRRRAAAGGQR